MLPDDEFLLPDGFFLLPEHDMMSEQEKIELHQKIENDLPEASKRPESEKTSAGIELHHDSSVRLLRRDGDKDIKVIVDGSEVQKLPESGIIDLFEHLMDLRMKRWKLDQSEFSEAMIEARKLLRQKHPAAALVTCRTILEGCLGKFFEKHIGKTGNMPLDEVLRNFSRKAGLPRKVYALAMVVKELGNVGAHHIRPPDFEHLSHREAQISLLALALLLEWYHRTMR